MSSEAELRSQLEEAMQAAELYLEQLGEKDDELAELRERNAQLEEELVSEGRGGDLELRDELRDLRSRLERSEDELERAMDSAKEQESRARDLDLQTKALKMEKLKLEAELQKEQERAELMEESMQALRQRSEQAAEQEGRIGAREKSHKKTLIKALGENEELRREVAELEQVVQTLYQAVNEKDAALKEKDQHLEATVQELRDTESEVEELKRVVHEKDTALAAAHEELSAVGELEQEISERVKSKVSQWKTKVKELEAELEREKEKERELQKKCDSLLLESGLREVEQQLVASEERNKSVLAELEETKALLEESHSELVQLARENEEMRTDQGKFIQVALEKERGELERLRAIIATKDKVLEEERARYKELFEEKGSLEEELQDRELTLAEYERGHGLTEAVLKQKKLKGDVRRRDKEIRRLNHALSERIAAHEKLYETCRRLKKKAGLPENFQFDELELEEGLRGQTERLNALIRELESQNENLENERLRLLEALRKNAQRIGEKGSKFYGLTAEQVLLVNQFAENVRDGRVDLPLDDKSLQLKEEVMGLKKQVHELQRELAAAEMAIEQQQHYQRGHVGHGSDGNEKFSSPSSSSPPSPSSHAGGLQRHHHQSDGEHQSFLEKQMERMAQDQVSMISELKLELQRALSSVVGMQRSSSTSGLIASTGASSPSSPSPKPDPKYEKLMDILETKLQGGGSQAALDREQVETMRNELQRQSEMNEQLVKRLQDAEMLVSRLSSTPAFPASASSPSFTGDFTLQQQRAMTVSPLAQEFHDSQLANLRLPPEEWTESYIMLNSRLSVCIEKLVSKEKHVVQLETKLREYEDKMQLFAAQMSILYREHLETKSSWEQETAELQKQADEARAERDALRTKARRLDTLCAVLEDDDDQAARNQVKELTRKIATLEVNEVVLARKYNLLAEEERVSRNAKEVLQYEMVQAETALRERVLYLEEWKAGAQAELFNLSKRLDKCIPRDIHEQTVRNLALVKHKYRDLIKREAQLRGRTSGAQALRRRVDELQAQLELARADGLQYRQQATSLQDEIRRLSSSGDNEGQSSPSQSDLVAKLKGEAVEKQILLESALKRAEIFERRVNELTEELKEETNRANEAESSLETATHVSNKLEEQLADMRDLYQGGANREERKVMEDRIQELEQMFETLARENNRYRELAEIASRQVQAFEMNQQAKDKEIDSLRTQLREMNARSDDDAIIGKIQHELTTTKVSYQLFVRKFEMAKVAIRRNELEIHKLEGVLDNKDQLLRRTREEARARVLSLQIALENLGVCPSDINDKNNNSGTFVSQSEFILSGMERLSETISKLGETAERSEESLRRSEAARRNLEIELDKRQVELESVRSLLADLRSRIFSPSALSGDKASTTADANASSPDTVESQRNLAQRILDLNEDLKRVKLESVRQKRELQHLREEKVHLERLREKDEEHMERLEESIANAENALRRKQDEATLRAAADPGAKDSFGLPLLAIPPANRRHQTVSETSPSEEKSERDKQQEDQDHQERMAMLQHSELVAELQTQIRDADRREEQLQRRLEREGERVKYLRKKLRAEGIDDESDDGQHLSDSDDKSHRPNNNNNKNSGGKYYEADARKLQAAAQQTIASLKDIVNRKNQIIEGLKHKIDLTRKNFMAERERDQAEIERLTEKLYEDNKAAIGKLRTAYEDVSRGAIPGQVDGGIGGPDHTLHKELLERLEEADAILERKDRRILELESVIEELRILRQDAEDKAGKNAEIAENLREKVKNMVVQTESKGHDLLVKQLRGQLVAKDKKLSGLRAAVVALKNEFVKAEEEHEEELIKKDREISRLTSTSSLSRKAEDQDDSNDSVQSLKRKLEALKERVDQTRTQLASAKKKEEKLRSENKRLQEELDQVLERTEEQEGTASKSSVEIKRFQRQVDSLKRENLRLKEALENAGGMVVPTGSTENADQSNTGARRRDRESKSNDPSGQREEDLDMFGLDASGGKKRGNSDGLKAQLAELERKLRISEAQNAALRSAAKSNAGGNVKTLQHSSTPSALATWETDKKLEKRVQVLTKRLEERSKELEAARAQAEQAKQLLDKTVKDRSTLQARLARVSGGTDASKWDAGGQHLKTKLDEYEKEIEWKDARIAELRRVAEVEQRGEIAKLKKEITSTRARVLELEDDLDTLRVRSRRSGADSLQVAEDQFVREDELRQQLSQARKDVRGLEAELLEKENTVLELRFELEQEHEKTRQLERTASRGEGKTPEGRSPTGPNGKRAAGERFKRERDLENVVESLQKVVGKLQAENERLKRSTNSNAKYGDLNRQVKALRQEKEELEVNNQALTRRLQHSTEASAKAVRLEDAFRGLKRQMRERDTSLENEKRRNKMLTEENERLLEEVEQANARLHRSSGPDANLRRQVEEQRALIAALQREKRTSVGDMSSSADGLREENERLKAENERLLNELNAFDLDFFEEIEDLKYKYQQALQENRALKRQVSSST